MLSSTLPPTTTVSHPRKSLYDAFVAWEGANGYRLNKTVLTYDQVADFGVTLQTGAYVYGNEGYFMWKNQAYKEDCVSDMSFFQAAQYTNLKVMRYAEVLLLAAEAHLQAGNTSKALDYINQIRVRRATALLGSGSLSVQQIAEQCGFSDGNYFSRIFKKINGTSPNEYRKSQKKHPDR